MDDGWNRQHEGNKCKCHTLLAN